MFSLFLSCRVVLVAVLVLVGSVSVNAFSMRRAPPNLPTDVNPDIIKGRTDVLCLGEVLFDCIANEDTCGLTVDEIVAKNKYQKYAGGAVANVACALSRLGVRSTFAGGIGNDADGRELMKMLDSLKVETMCSVNTSPTRRVMVTRNEQRDRTFNGFWNNKHSGTFADCDYQPAVSSKWFLESTTLAVVMGTLGLAAGNTALVMERIARDIKANRIQGKDASTPLLVIDMNVRDVFWPGIAPSVVKDTIVNFAKGADIIKLTDEEASWAFGITAEEALRKPEALLPFLNPTVGVLVTAGAKGAAYHMVGVGSGFVPAYEVKVEDTTGAGDAFTAGFLAALAMDRKSILTTAVGAERAVKMGCAAGALTCTKTGAINAQPSLSEVLNLMMNGGKQQSTTIEGSKQEPYKGDPSSILQ